MGFNKRYISKNSIKNAASGDFRSFFNYFNNDANFFEDDFSSKIFDELKNYTIDNEESIINIMDKCK